MNDFIVAINGNGKMDVILGHDISHTKMRDAYIAYMYVSGTSHSYSQFYRRLARKKIILSGSSYNFIYKNSDIRWLIREMKKPPMKVTHANHEMCCLLNIIPGKNSTYGFSDMHYVKSYNKGRYCAAGPLDIKKCLIMYNMIRRSHYDWNDVDIISESGYIHDKADVRCELMEPDMFLSAHGIFTTRKEFVQYKNIVR